jgi:hypothetical protein
MYLTSALPLLNMVPVRSKAVCGARRKKVILEKEDEGADRGEGNRKLRKKKDKKKGKKRKIKKKERGKPN